MAHRLASEAESDLDDISYYVAKGGGSIAVADRVVDRIAARLALLVRQPRLERRRDELHAGLRSFAVGRSLIFYRIEDENADHRPRACTISSVIFLASPNSIMVFGRKNSSFSTPA